MKPHVIFIALILLIGVADASVVAPTSWGKGWKLFNVNGTYWDLMGEPGVQNGSLKNVSCLSNCTGFSAQVSREQIPGQTGVDDWQNSTMNNSCPYTYCIRWNGSMVEAITGGRVEFSGTDAATVHNQAYATAGTLPKKTFMSTGSFNLSTELLPKNYSILYNMPASYMLNAGVGATVNDGMVDIPLGYHDIDIIGGTYNGNSSGQSSWMIIIRMMGHDLTLSKANITNSKGDCIFSRDINNRVFDNEISYCNDTGIVMGGLKTATNASYGKGYNNYIHNSTVGLDISNDADYVEYFGNILRNITDNGISITYTVNGKRPPHHSKILFNQLDHAGGNDSGKCGINIVYAGADNTLIEGNTVNYAARNGICGNSGNNKIINNFVNNTLWNGINLAGNDNTVFGNVVSASSQDALVQGAGLLIYGKNNTVENNRIYDNQTVKTQYRGIRELTGADYNIIRNNKLGDTAGGAKITIVGSNTTADNNYGAPGYDHGISTTCTSKTAFGAGDTCTNSTTAVQYTYNGSAWVVNTPRVSIPSSATTPCQDGEIAYNSTYFYACIADNIWVRTNMTSW